MVIFRGLTRLYLSVDYAELGTAHTLLPELSQLRHLSLTALLRKSAKYKHRPHLTHSALTGLALESLQVRALLSDDCQGKEQSAPLDRVASLPDCTAASAPCNMNHVYGLRGMRG